MVATDEVLGHDLWITGVEQFLDHRLIALSDRGLEFITRCTKSGTAQQMRHERHILLMHVSVSFRTRLCSLVLRTANCPRQFGGGGVISAACTMLLRS